MAILSAIVFLLTLFSLSLVSLVYVSSLFLPGFFFRSVNSCLEKIDMVFPVQLASKCIKFQHGLKIMKEKFFSEIVQQIFFIAPEHLMHYVFCFCFVVFRCCLLFTSFIVNDLKLTRKKKFNCLTGGQIFYKQFIFLLHKSDFET